VSNDLKGKVSRFAAEVYEDFFVPALFSPWAGRTADAAHLAAGQAVLDVACGTGVLAREAVERVGPSGSVIGLDRNEEMLAVARRTSFRVDWQHGVAEDLGFVDGAFDAVVSQFGLVFFDDRIAALREMWRVLRPTGRLAVTVWDQLEHSPGYADLRALVERLFGNRVARELEVPFTLGDPRALGMLFEEAGVTRAEVATLGGWARFPSLKSWIQTEIRGWTLAEMIDDAQLDLLAQQAELDLRSHVGPDGIVIFRCPALIVTAIKP
jgi:SAM-dependent methyltransferase